MQKQIVFTVKDPGKLESYFSKYKNLSTSIFLILYKDEMEIRGFSKDKDFTKIAKLRYSDVFEEAQIDVGENIFIGLVDKISRLTMSVNQYEDAFQLVFNIRKITDPGLVSLLNKKGYIDDDKIYTTGDIQFVSDRLTLNIKTALNMVRVNFELNDVYLETFLETNSENKILGRFDISGNELKQLKKLSASDSNKDLEFGLDGDSISISSIDFFDLNFDLKDSNQIHDFKLDKLSLRYMDDEDQEIIIMGSEAVDNYMILKSKETETLCFCSAKVGADVAH